VSDCSPHREFLAALADGETALVPASTIEHVNECRDCSREIRVHRSLTSKLREAGESLEAASPRRVPIVFRRRVLGVIGAAAILMLAVVGGAAGWSLLSRQDPVQAAVMASSQPLQIQSTDPSKVAAWCFNESGRGLPAVHLDGMQVVGARMDRVPSTDIVTVVYAAPTGSRVSVSWLEGQAPGGSGVEETKASGHEVLIVHSTVGTAVISGSSSAAMWEVAAAIESA
jgi:hypothetical protein